MPKGVYDRKGKPAHNKGKFKKVELFKNKQPIECKRHGIHLQWRLYSGNNVQCKYCSKMYASNIRKNEPIKILIRDAKARKLELDITEEYLKDILNKQDNKCAISGIDFTESNKPSLDRIDSNKGYLKGNVQLLLLQVNKMKSNFDQKFFIDMCIKIAYSVAKKK